MGHYEGLKCSTPASGSRSPLSFKHHLAVSLQGLEELSMWTPTYGLQPWMVHVTVQDKEALRQLVDSAAAHSNDSCDVLRVAGGFQNRHMIGGHKKIDLKTKKNSKKRSAVLIHRKTIECRQIFAFRVKILKGKRWNEYKEWCSDAIQSAADSGSVTHRITCWMWQEQASSYLLRARCGAFQRGAFKGATGALGVHSEESLSLNDLTWLHWPLTRVVTAPQFCSNISMRNRPKKNSQVPAVEATRARQNPPHQVQMSKVSHHEKVSGLHLSSVQLTPHWQDRDPSQGYKSLNDTLDT